MYEHTGPRERRRRLHQPCTCYGEKLLQASESLARAEAGVESDFDLLVIFSIKSRFTDA